MLLDAIGVRYRILPAAIDESPLAGEPAIALVERLATEKASTTASRVDDLPVLAADTIVVVDGLVLGKPGTEAEGVAMLARLSARHHEVITAVAMAQGPRMELRRSVTRVKFRAIAPTEACAYWASGEARDKAGGYGIQGIAGIFVEHIEGSYSGVVGLPIAETEGLLRAFGVNTWRYRGG
ncbi:MAG: septum formation inhibitor Maf [Gammaproteobacteria bacterium]|nr:septum formation inhibitor Maf [Gammaproteobacteria bacterium]